VPGENTSIIRFGVFEVDLRARELRRQGSKVKLQDQPFQVLAMLLERPGQLVTREELRARIWSDGVFVDFEKSLSKAINKIREALGDSPENSRFIETLAKRGYRFLVPVEAGQPAKLAELPLSSVHAAPDPSAGTVREPLQESASDSAIIASLIKRYKKGAIGSVAMVAALVALGMFWQSRRTLAPAWVGTRLGGPSVAFGPRISPDSHLLAFIALVNQQTQVAVMKSDGSSWTLLTAQKDAGYVQEVYWSLDGSKLYFHRYSDQPRGVYSIPALGGELRLLRENAFGGLPLPDGSLIVATLVSQGDTQLRRFWPETGREEPLPAFLGGGNDMLSVTVFPGGKEIAFYGIYSTSQDHPGTAGIYALDLDSKKARALGGGAWSGANRPMSSTLDGRSVITLAQVEDTYQVVTVPRDGSVRHQVLFSLPKTEFVLSISAAADSSVYVDLISRPNMLLQFSPDGGDPDENPIGNLRTRYIGSLPGGKLLFPSVSADKAHLVAGRPGGEALPFLQTGDESTFPFAASSGDNVALLLGTPPRQQTSPRQAMGVFSSAFPSRPPRCAASLFRPIARCSTTHPAGLFGRFQSARPRRRTASSTAIRW
jgi:DNA-binding winged helix-turn-helix (wHTH) protein